MVDGDPVCLELVEDRAEAQGDGDAGAPVEPAEGVKGGVEGKAGDHAEGVGVGAGRAVAMKVGQDVEARGEVGVGDAKLRDAGDDARMLGRSGREAVQAHQVVEERAGGGLAAFAEPEAGEDGVEVRTPDAGGGVSGAGELHQAGRGAGDQSEVPLEVGGGGKGTENAEGAGMGVDEAGRHVGGGGEAEVAGRPRVSGPRSVPTGVAVSGRPARVRRSERPTAARKS